MIFHYDSKVISIPWGINFVSKQPVNLVICGWGRRIARDLFVPDGTRIGPLKVDEMVVGAVLKALFQLRQHYTGGGGYRCSCYVSKPVVQMPTTETEQIIPCIFLTNMSCCYCHSVILSDD